MRPRNGVTPMIWTVGKADGDDMRLTTGDLQAFTLNTIDEDGVRLYHKDLLLIPESHPYFNCGILIAEPDLNTDKVVKMLHQLYKKILNKIR